MKHATTILFDWDGTLLNSFPASYRASMSVLRHYGIEIDRERFMETYSPNWYDSYRALGLPKDEWSNADSMWRRSYREETSPPFPFTERLLNRLRSEGLTLGIVTAGDRDRVTKELHANAFSELFDTVVCFEDTEEKKPHPAPLICALERLEISAESAVYVGDRPEDIIMGKRVGAKTIAVESEYGPRAILEEAGPDVILPDAGHIPASLGLPL